MSASNRLFLSPYDQLDDETVAASLAIILDTANAARIDDQRYKIAKMSLKIDHHPLGESYATHQIVIETASSTSEIVAGLIKQVMLEEPISMKSARYLYMGILTRQFEFLHRQCHPQHLGNGCLSGSKRFGSASDQSGPLHDR